MLLHFFTNHRYHQSVPVEVPELEMKATFGLASPVEYQAPTKSKEWTSEAYAGFKMVPPDQGDKKVSALLKEY